MRRSAGFVSLCPNSMLALTVRCGNSAPSWNTSPMRLRSGGRFSPVDESNKVRPSSAIRPESGLSSPAMQCRVVVFPLPEGPNMSVIPELNSAVTDSAKSP